MKSRRRGEVGDGFYIALGDHQRSGRFCLGTVNWRLRDLAVARFDRDFNFVERRSIDREQYPSFRFVSD
jgi:hypothetical protein